MVSTRELVYYVIGAWRLARLDPDGMDHFENTVRAFWRSFNAAIFVAPAFAILTILQFNQVTVRSGAIMILIVEVLIYVIGWLLFPFVMLGVSEALDRRTNYCRYIAAYNWSAVVWITLFLGVVLIRETGMLPGGVGVGLLWIARILMFAYAAYIAKVGLDITVPAAMGIVLIDFILAVIMDVATAAILGISYSSAS